MYRLFVGIQPPPETFQQLLPIMHGVSGARWQQESQLHVTLRFIGQVDGNVANDIAAELDHLSFTPFAIALRGVGMFDAHGYVDALWAGVEPREPLAHLHRKIDRMCVRCGLAPERRAYLPHMMLARMGRSAGPVEPFLAANAALTLPAFTVSTVTLYESHLSHGGAIYRPVAQFPAQGG